MGRPKKKDKVQVVSASVTPAVKELLYKRAEEHHSSVAAYCADLIELGLTHETGKSVIELIKQSKRNGASLCC